ncbi:MAG: adenylate/guanylate cyclase domain-containing protein [Bdellovibrionota bacterium]
MKAPGSAPLPPNDETRGSFSRLFSRLGNPLDWCAADKSAFISIPLALYIVLSFFILPRVDEYRAHLSEFDFTVLWYVDTWRKWTAVLWTALGAMALSLRRRYPESKTWYHAVSQLWALTFAPICYALGATTTSTLGFAVMTGALGGILLIGWIPTLLGMVTFSTLSLGADLAAYYGKIPYAPAFQRLAIGKDGKIQGSWLLTNWILVGIGAGATLVVFGYIFDRWRDREERLAEAQVLLGASHERLEKATGLIRRYVPGQLADEIISGNYAGQKHERKQLTIFFSDIQGFTQASDQLDPERLAGVLNEYLSEMTRIAVKHGGTIDKFVGDALLVFFGAPSALPEKEQALRCVRMAVEMQARMKELGKKWYDEGIQTPFQIRVGINSGTASVGDFGSAERMDYTAIGTQVNLAARLQTHCEPGKILLSHSTWGLVHHDIPCAPKGEVQVKGIHYPVKVYEVEG